MDLLAAEGRLFEVALYSLEVFHYAFPFLALRLATDANVLLIHSIALREQNGLFFVFFVGLERVCTADLLGHKLIEVLVELSLVLEAEGDVLFSLL